MRLELVRFAYLKNCTLGTLRVGALELATIERPWLPNPAGPGGTPSQSCVPDGLYQVRPHNTERFPNTYAIINASLGVYYQALPAGQTWGRTAILMHVGNRVRDVIGCIAVGTEHGQLDGELAVLSSLVAMDRLRAALGRGEHELLVRPSSGTVDDVKR